MPGHSEGHFSVVSLRLRFHFGSWTIAGNAATILQNPVPFDSMLCFWQRKRHLKIRPRGGGYIRGYIYAVLADMDIEPASIHPRKIGVEGRRLAALTMQEDTALGDPVLEPGLREANGHQRSLETSTALNFYAAQPCFARYATSASVCECWTEVCFFRNAQTDI